MSASLQHGYIASQLNRKAQRLAFLRLAMPWVGAVALVAVYAVVGGL